MSTQPTTRELDDPQAPEELRAALRSARADGPSAARLAQARENLLQRAAGAATALAGVEAPGATQVGGGAPLPSASPGWIGKLLVVGALVGVGLGAWLWQGTPATQPPAPAKTPVPAATSADPSLPPATAPGPAPAERTPHVEPEAEAAPAAPSTEAREPEEPEATARPRRRAVRRAGAEGSRPPASYTLADEIALLGRARRALQDRPAETQRLTEEHIRLFPQGRFVQEREVLAVHALLRQGALDAALGRGRRFLETYPDSTHARRVATLLEEATR